MRFLVKAAAIWAIALLAHAQTTPDSEAVAGPVASTTVAARPPEPQERRWRLGAAVGYGMRTNPLIQSEDIPVLVDIDIAYFGKRWFFDNGDIGYELIDNAFMTTNLVARANTDRAFFSNTNIKYVTYSVLAGGATRDIRDSSTGQPISELQALPLRPPRRLDAVELGLETLLGGEWGQATVRVFHDVSGVHDGLGVSGDYSYRITRGRLTFSPSIGLNWKSAALSDYYWGVHPEEASLTLSAYEAKGGVGWEAGLRGSYYLTKSLRIAASANYERLQHSIAMSPLVRRSHVVGYFAGLGWQF